MKERSGMMTFFRFGLWKLRAAGEGGRGYEEWQMPPIRREEEQVPFFAETPRNADVGTGTPGE